MLLKKITQNTLIKKVKTMIEMIPVKYGNQINLKAKDFIISSDGTCCSEFDFDSKKLHQEAESIAKNMDSELLNEFILLRNYHNRNLVSFENTLDK